MTTKRFDYANWQPIEVTGKHPEFQVDIEEIPNLPGRGQGSKFLAEDYQDEDGNWRVRIRSQLIKFDDEAKLVFLSVYSQVGRFETAASAAGVSGSCVRVHMKKDTEFAEALLVAQDHYRDKVISHAQNLIFNGTQKETYDRNGNMVSTETVYPIRLIELELKKVDEGYRDKKEVDFKMSGGVMIAPKEVESIDDWKQKFGPKVIEEEAVEVDDDKGQTESVTVDQ